MAIIKKTISGLKPNTEYLFALKPKNTEIMASDTTPETIRVSIPAYLVSPSNIVNLTLAANFETVMFSFDPVNDVDLDYFEYIIYNGNNGSGSIVNSKTATNGDTISGIAKANVFTVSVPNSTSVLTTQYSRKSKNS